MQVPLSNPDITNLERRYVQSVLETPHLSLGPVLPKFESSFAQYLGTRHAIAVNSGTSGLHLAVKALDIREDDVVVTTPFSFVASANCILFERAKPLFVDIDSITYNIDCNKMEKAIDQFDNKKGVIKAVLPVHVFGRPCDMEKIMKIARKHNLHVIEDACEAIGAEYLEKKVGTFGDIGVFAFYPNKQMTTGEGGMIVTNNEKIASLCKSLRNQGRAESGEWLLHERLGYNYRLSEINCALGLAQLERIEELITKRAEIAELYNTKLQDLDEIRIATAVKGIEKISWFVYVVQLSNTYSREDRDVILSGLRKAGIGCNNYFSPIHLQPFYQQMFGFKEGDFPVTEHVAARTIALPFYNNLKEEQIKFVTETLKKLL